jgi:2,4-dienoyl-CoA reductase-like NADH-dependent reductase (Old Yellow Enzyme family)/NADPH-dependent 2,4-dienoyl-CoA reductase/sulfur reductase-like enzyme
MAKLFTHLLSPARIGKTEFRNRMFVTAMGVNLADPDGYCGERVIAFHEAQAKGGAAMVMTGVVGVSWPHGGNLPFQVALSDDRFIPGMSAVAAAVHKHGARYAVQLHHGGLVAPEDAKGGRPIWIPSFPEPRMGDLMEGFLDEELAVSSIPKMGMAELHIMTEDDIRKVIDHFAAASGRAVRAGADLIEIHGGHGYLLSAFLSPKGNKRDDDYGGPLENRARLALSVMRAVRETVGPDFPVSFKIDAREHGVANGITLDDSRRTAQMLEAAGASSITVTSYHDPVMGRGHSDSHTPDIPAHNLKDAEAIRAAINIPVIASGRLENDVADTAVGKKRIDFYSMGRKLLADPELPNKLAAGKADDVRPCVYCYTCISAIYTEERVRCAVNPRLGVEFLPYPQTAAQPKRVAVIGGGPGGMETARLLDGMGHKVVLLEKSGQLGGTLRFASIAYEANERLLDWLTGEIGKSNVDVRLNTAATPALVKSLGVDAVVVASGARRDFAEVPGASGANVLTGEDLQNLVLGNSSDRLKEKTSLATRLIAKAGAATGMSNDPKVIREATKLWLPLGDAVVIIGGELVGLELAEFLLHRKRNVWVIDDIPKFGKGLPLVRRWRVLDRIREAGGVMLPGCSGITVDGDGVTYVDAAGQPGRLQADNIIIAKGASGDMRLADAFVADGQPVHVVGDCRGVGYIEGAMRSASEVAAVI